MNVCLLLNLVVIHLNFLTLDVPDKLKSLMVDFISKAEQVIFKNA